MKRWISALTALLVFICGLPDVGCAEGVGSLFDMNAEIAAYDAETEKYLYACGDTADLSALGSGEFYTYYLSISYTGSGSYTADTLEVSVDGGEKWGWQGMTFEAGARWGFHVYYVNMKSRMTEGVHTVVWYIDGEAVHEETFRFTRSSGASAAQSVPSGKMDWSSVFPLPAEAEIGETNRNASVRSPYIYGRTIDDWNFRFTEYSVDFRADELPQATYCCLANMQMDLSGLSARHKNVHTEYQGVNMYAGLQRRWNDKVGIMAFWDIYYDDENGVQQTIRAKRVYPEALDTSEEFGGEGTGAHALVPYEWEAGRWYRMLLQCSTSEETGNTLVAQWVMDLESGAWTKLCEYDTGLTGSCFTGPAAFFLENFDNRYAGEVRTLEVKNVRARDASSGQWVGISSAVIGSSSGLPAYNGSYAYGSQGDRFWVITSGAGGDWYGTDRAPANNTRYGVSGQETGSPY